MALLLRAITPLADRAVELGQVVRVDTPRLTAWATDLLDTNTKFGRDDLLQHHLLVEAIFSRVDACLPARFPMWVDDFERLRRQTEARQSEFLDRLAHVMGCCEIAVTGLWLAGDNVAEANSTAASGREYLARRQRAFASSDRRLARARRLSDEVERAAGVHLLDSRRKVCPSPSVALSLALLVKRTSAEQVRATVGYVTEDVRILINGPWPPYSFADIGPEQGDG